MEKSGTTFRTMELVFPDRDTAVLRPTRAARISRRVPVIVVLMFAGFMLAVLAGGSSQMRETFGRAAPYLVWGALGLCVLLAVAGCFGRFGSAGAPIRIDRREKRLWQKRRKGDAGTQSGLDIRLVGAVQLCHGRTWVMEGGERFVGRRHFTTYELNLVFSQPRGERFRLAAHQDEAAIRRDALELAQFLKVPLLDHADSRCAGR